MPCGQCHRLRDRGRRPVTGCRRRYKVSQAEAFRVPAADMNAVKIPEGISEDQALMMTDALATAWFGARRADIRPGSSVAVIGLGPIGLMAVESAWVMGAHVVYAIDPIAERRAMAEERGAITLHPQDALETIREATLGRKLDCVVEVVGSDATVDLALRLVTRRGTVSVIGVQQSKRYAFPLERAFAAGLTFRIGTCSVPGNCPRCSRWSARAASSPNARSATGCP